MKKLLSAIACFSICFAIQAQTQLSKPQDGNSGTQKKMQTQTQQSQELKNAKTEAVAPQTTCPKAATCPKQAASNQADAVKPACCAKHQATQAEAAKPACCAKHQATQADGETKPEPKAGCNHQSADQKAKCNHGSDEKSTCPKKKEEGK